MRPALDTARRADTEARAAVEQQAKIVSAGFMDDADKRQSDRAKLVSLREDAEDAASVLVETERRHAEALAADEQGRRQAVYSGAKAKADAAASTLAKTYPAAVRDLLAVLKTLAEAQQAVVMANGQLPDGAEILLDPEMVARGAAGQPREVISDEWVELWGRQDLGTPTDDQESIQDLGRGWGKLFSDLQPCYRKRLFRKVVFREYVVGSYPTPLAAALQLPDLKGRPNGLGREFPRWSQSGSRSHCPGSRRTGRGAGSLGRDRGSSGRQAGQGRSPGSGRVGVARGCASAARWPGADLQRQRSQPRGSARLAFYLALRSGPLISHNGTPI